MSTKKEIIHQVVDLLNKDFKKKLNPPVNYDSRYDNHDYGVEFYYPEDTILNESLDSHIDGLYEYVYNRKHDYENREDAKRHAEGFIKSKNLCGNTVGEMSITSEEYNYNFIKFNVYFDITLYSALARYGLVNTFKNAE